MEPLPPQCALCPSERRLSFKVENGFAGDDWQNQTSDCLNPRAVSVASVSMDPSVLFSDPKILGGVPVFTGTAVPVQTLIDYWEGGLPLYEFLLDFPAVQKRQAKEVLDWFSDIKKSGKRPAAELQAIQRQLPST